MYVNWKLRLWKLVHHISWDGMTLNLVVVTQIGLLIKI